MKTKWKRVGSDDPKSVADGDGRVTLKTLGRALRKFINTDEVISLLAEGDWGAGGCWILAETLKRWFREPARLMAIVGR
jgi:hypothetical protein